ncbi:MAG: hypothetical protein ABW167_09540 [Baekduia sp.]
MEATLHTTNPGGNDLLTHRGERTLTVTSKTTHAHVTLRLDGDGDAVRFTDYDGEMVALWQRGRGIVEWGPHVSGHVRWTVNALVRYGCGEYELLPAVAWLDFEDPL